LALGLNLVPSEAVWLAGIFSLAVFPVGLTVEWIYEAKQQVAAISIARILKGALFCALVVLIVHEPGDVETSALAYVASLTVPSVWLLIVARRQFQIREFRLTASRARALLVEAWPIAVATLLSQYSLFFGTTFLGYRASGEEVGLYSAAHRLIIFVWAYGITTAHRVLLPSFSQSHQVSTTEFDARLLATVRWTVLAALPFGCIGSFVAAEVIHVLFGAGYEAAGRVLAILLWALVVGVLRSPFDVGLLASSRQAVYLRGMLILGLSHTVLDSAGYLFGGLIGLAMGVVGSELVYAVYIAFQHERSFILQTLRMAFQPLAAGLLTAIVLSVIQLPWGLTVLVGLIVYTAVLLGVGEFSVDGRKLVKAFRGFFTER
jgi:O-antigen/teichoic acid export membrane protein